MRAYVRSGRRGISGFIAALILTVAVLASASVVFAYYSGGAGSAGAGLVAQQVKQGVQFGQVIMVSGLYRSANALTYMVQDVGNLPIQISQCFIQGQQTPCGLTTQSGQPASEMTIDKTYYLTVSCLGACNGMSGVEVYTTVGNIIALPASGIASVAFTLDPTSPAFTPTAASSPGTPTAASSPGTPTAASSPGTPTAADSTTLSNCGIYCSLTTITTTNGCGDVCVAASTYTCIVGSSQCWGTTTCYVLTHYCYTTPSTLTWPTRTVGLSCNVIVSYSISCNGIVPPLGCATSSCTGGYTTDTTPSAPGVGCGNPFICGTSIVSKPTVGGGGGTGGGLGGGGGTGGGLGGIGGNGGGGGLGKL